MAKNINGIDYTDYDDMIELLEISLEEMAEINFRAEKYERENAKHLTPPYNSR